MRRKRSIGIIVRHALVEIQPGRAHTLVEEEEKEEDYSRFWSDTNPRPLRPLHRR
jgi:hypothetical protein